MISDQYAAGFFDGEGCIYVYKHLREKEQRGKRDFDVHVRITASNTSLAPLEALKEKYGGNLSQSYEAHGNRQACFQWTVASRKASAFLKSVAPFLLVKREKALKAIYLADRINEKKRVYITGMRGSYVPPEEWATRLKLLESCNNKDVRIEDILKENEG